MRWTLLLVCLGTLVAGSNEGREIAWKDFLKTRFDTRYLLPGDGEGEAGRPDSRFVRELDQLATQSLVKGQRLMLGDFLAEMGQRRDEAAFDRAFKKLIVDRKLEVPIMSYRKMRQLLVDVQMNDDDWEFEESSKNDGLLEGKSLKLPATNFWKGFEGDRDICQVATLAQADLTAWRNAETDFPAYLDDRGLAYEEVGYVKDSHYFGKDGSGRDFSAYQLYFRHDLPFPFSDYACRMNVLSRLDEKGRAYTHLYSKSKDVHWLAGTDFFIPVRDSKGVGVGTIVVRWLGFDLDGVPEETDDRLDGLRAGIANLKMRAEKKMKAVKAPVYNGKLPKLEMVGKAY